MDEAPLKKTPLWLAIADSLRAAIAEGQYGEGDKLPTEAELSRRFGVNRHTVRHALSRLVEDGLVHTRRGAGAFVLARPLDYPIGDRVRFHQNLLAAGRLPEKKMLQVETRAATAQDARRLDLPEGATICCTHSLSFADGVPVAVAESRFPEHRLPGLADILKQQPSITEALAAVGVSDYMRTSTRLSAQIATATQAAQMRLREGAPVLFVSSISVDDTGRPVEFGQTWFAGDRISLTLKHTGE